MTPTTHADRAERLASLKAEAIGLGVGFASATEAGPEWRLSTVPWGVAPMAVLQPSTAEQVPELLATASRLGIPVHPVSRGRSWGLGSRLPLYDAAVLDLARLDRILDVDMENGTARLEPGVTFSKLQQRLKQEGLAFHLPSFGGPPDASVLANALERGEGAGPYGDRYAHLWDLDVALATGKRLRTGHTDETLSRVHSRPAGPLLEGLFSQSGLGIVLSGRICLQPTLPYAAMVLAEIGPTEKLPPVMNTLRRLLHAGLFPPHALAIWNGAKRASSLVGRHGAFRDNLEGKHDEWALSIIVTAPHPDLLAMTVKILTAELEPSTTSIEVQTDRNEDGTRRETAVTGFSDGHNVMSAYWGKQKRPDIPGNPDLDGCGFLWMCPALPFKPDALKKLEALLSAATRGKALFPALGVQAVSPRALHGYVSVAWDRAAPAADRDAKHFHAELSRSLEEAGFALFRRGLADMQAQLQNGLTADHTRLDLLQHIKQVLDPAGILSPGRIPSPSERPKSPM